MKRLLTGLLAGVLTATLVGISLAWLLASQDRERAPSSAAATAPGLTRALSNLLDLEHERVRDLCEHDVRVERLGLELASLGAAMGDASPTARVLAKSHGQEIWLFHQAGKEQVRLLGSSRTPPTRPELAVLRRAAEGPVAWGAPGSQLVFACRRALTSGALWIVKSQQPLELLGADESVRVGVDPSATELLRVSGIEGAADVVITDRAKRTAPPEQLGLLLALVIGSGLIGGVLGLLLTRTVEPDDAVLVELERAATRVAEGDLTSTINLRVGGKADQTFRSFDRMTRELREMRVRLAEAERAAAFQEIARRIAHELKNPLSPIQLAMETLRKAHEKKVAGFDEIFDESTRAVLEEVRRMERIVREFSEFARLPKPQPGALALDALVEEVAALYRPSDVTLEIEKDASLPNVRVDREQITQVLVNLLQNAFDAVRAAGTASPKVLVSVRVEDNHVVLAVDDNGPGVPASDRERIFEPYVTSKAHGTGLGLAIVKRIVTDHHAAMRLSESALGGARFSVVFPSGTADHSASIP